MSDNTNLYLVQNMMIFMEECFINEPSSHDYFTINPYYVQNKNTLKALITDIQKLYPGLQYISYEKCSGSSWNSIYMSSYMQKEYIHTVTDMAHSRIILVEDGLFDYISPSEPYLFYNDKDLYLFRPEIASPETIRANVKQLNFSSGITHKFSELYKESTMNLSKLDSHTTVLFTTPFSEDFNAYENLTDTILNYLKYNLSIDQIVLKKHPRDHFTYTSDIVQITECPQNVPGQFLDEMFDGKKIFLFPSTVSFMCGELSNIIFLNVLPDNREYSSAFDSVMNSRIFSGQKSIQYISI